MYQCLTRPHFLNCIIFHFFENILYIPFTKMCARYLFILFHSNKSFGQMSAATDRADDESGDCIGHSLESVPGFSCYRSYQGGRSNEAVGRVAQFQRVAVNDAQTTVNIILGRPRREIYDRERESSKINVWGWLCPSYMQNKICYRGLRSRDRKDMKCHKSLLSPLHLRS